MPVIDEIAAKLVAEGVGTVGSNIIKGSKGTIPDGDGPYLSLTETGGTGAARTHNSTAVERPTIHLLARAKSYLVARTMLKAAYDALGGAKGLHNVTLSGVFYQSITPRQQITDVGLDDRARPMLSYNIDIDKEPS